MTILLGDFFQQISYKYWKNELQVILTIQFILWHNIWNTNGRIIHSYYGKKSLS